MGGHLRGGFFFLFVSGLFVYELGHELCIHAALPILNRLRAHELDLAFVGSGWKSWQEPEDLCIWGGMCGTCGTLMKNDDLYISYLTIFG
jgi:hypothetical protein